MSYVDLDPLSAFTAIPATWLAQLLANTEALHDGTGFANGAIPGSALSTSAITLGYADRNANFTTTTEDAPVDITDLEVTVTIPSGGRRVKITAWFPNVSSTAAAATGLTTYIREGSTTLASSIWTMPGSQYGLASTVMYSGVLSAGEHILKASVAQNNAGTITVVGGATSKPFILVELI